MSAPGGKADIKRRNAAIDQPLLFNLDLCACGLTRADDGDDVAIAVFAPARTAGGNGAGDVVAVDLAVRHGRREFVALAIGVSGRRAALVARGEAAVDAVAVPVIGDDEHALLGLCGRDDANAEDGGEADQVCTHDKAR